MSIDEILKKYPKTEIELLLAHVLRKPKEFVFLHPGFILSSRHLNILSPLIKRRMRGEPIAYILGYKDFYGLRFKVNRNVLIPRPETEIVIERLKDLKSKECKKPLKILDVGTGSGAIIISMAKAPFTGVTLADYKGNSCKLYGSDISHKVLAVARQNAKIHHARIKFIKSDLLDNIRFVPDIVIANLPYGWSEWKNQSSTDAKGLKFEPQNALFTKEGGLYLYRKLLQQIAAREQKPKLIYLEIDPRQKRKIALLIKKHLPKSGIKFHRDYAGLWRYVETSVC